MIRHRISTTSLQIALSTAILSFSTAVTGLAATNPMTSGRIDATMVELTTETIPSQQLNSTPNTILIAGEIRDMMSRIPAASVLFANFDKIWANPAAPGIFVDIGRPEWTDPSGATDRKTVLLNFCRAQPQLGNRVSPQQCFRFLSAWALDSMETISDTSALRDLIDAARAESRR